MGEEPKESWKDLIELEIDGWCELLLDEVVDDLGMKEFCNAKTVWVGESAAGDISASE